MKFTKHSLKMIQFSIENHLLIFEQLILNTEIGYWFTFGFLFAYKKLMKYNKENKRYIEVSTLPMTKKAKKYVRR